MSSALQHEALVIASLTAGEVLVRMQPTQAESCAGCALASSCGPRRHKSGESIELMAATSRCKQLQFEAGQRVVVSPVRGNTSRAATLLLTLPLGGLVAGTVISSAFGATDGASALWGLAGAVAGFLPALLCGDKGRKLRWEVVGTIESTIEEQQI